MTHHFNFSPRPAGEGRVRGNKEEKGKTKCQKLV